ncbi:MAG: GAF domain-containing protein [bacterium]|nr:GAF domain-containing protein [bacterium]
MKKSENYKWTLKQVRSKVKKHVDVVATLANVAAILKERFPNFFWVGFYFLRGDRLILGPFQGPPACMDLGMDKGVCAAAATSGETVLVKDVHLFPGHVACDSRSNSEIVVPLKDADGNVRAVLDVDSEKKEDFKNVDKEGLEAVARMLTEIFSVSS